MRHMDNIDVSLILACYNESEIFEVSVEKIIQVLDGTSYTWEMIFIDDKSKDNTKELIGKVLDTYQNHNLSAYFHTGNQGRGQTVIDGFNQAKGRLVGFIDIDLEVGEWYITKFLEALDKGADVANAWRIYDIKLWGLPRWFATKGYILIRNLFIKLPYQDTEAGYKFFKREKLMPLLQHAKHPGWFFDTEIMALCFKHELKVEEIPVAFIRRSDKTSTVKLIPDTIKYFIDLIKFSRQFKAE
jgi:glycosyltransferase involved in cell wall biosynthesis